MATRTVSCLIVIFGALLAIPRAERAQLPHSLGSTRNQRRATTYRERAPDPSVPRITACLDIGLPGSSGGDIWVEATEQYNIEHFRSHITFTLRSNGKRKEIFTYRTEDGLDMMFAPPYSSRVVTVWESGSGIWVRVFYLTPQKVTLVLERGAKSQPEFAWDAILVNGINDSGQTEIWTWTGEKYKLAATVPFKQRYDALQKLPPSAWK